MLLLHLRLLDLIVVLVFPCLFPLYQRAYQVHNTLHLGVGTQLPMRLHLLLAQRALMLLEVFDGPFDTLFAEEVEAVLDHLRLDYGLHADRAFERVQDVLDGRDRRRKRRVRDTTLL